MLLSKIPCLDKGYVALLESSGTTKLLREIGEEFYGGTYPTSLEEIGTLTVAIKCPLFVQLYLSKFNLKVINVDSTAIEYFRPNAGEVAACDIHTSEIIADDIARTADALIINPKAYQADGCERFMSQVNTPISVYTTLIVSGSYGEWCKMAFAVGVPKPIKTYTEACKQIIESEWHFNG